MNQPNFDEIAARIHDRTLQMRRLLVDYRIEAAPLKPGLQPDDIHDWVHIAHLNQVLAFGEAFEHALRNVDTTDPLVFAGIARPAWEASVQLAWIHTDEDVLGPRWFDYAFFKAALDHHGGKSWQTQQNLLVSLWTGEVRDRDLRLVRDICARYLSSEQLDAALRNTPDLLEYLSEDFDLDDDFYEMSDDEFDRYLDEVDRRRDAVQQLRPLAHFLREVNSVTGWRYPSSWTTSSVKVMVGDLYGDYPKSALDREPLAVTNTYRVYQRLSEVVHCSGPTVLHLFRSEGPHLVDAGAALVRWSGEVLDEALERAIRVS